jgi:hypothetical protein
MLCGRNAENLLPNIDPNQIWGLRANCNFYCRKLMEKLEQIYRANQFTCQTTPGFSFSIIEKKTIERSPHSVSTHLNISIDSILWNKIIKPWPRHPLEREDKYREVDRSVRVYVSSFSRLASPPRKVKIPNELTSAISLP